MGNEDAGAVLGQQPRLQAVTPSGVMAQVQQLPQRDKQGIVYSAALGAQCWDSSFPGAGLCTVLRKDYLKLLSLDLESRHKYKH